MQDPQGHPTGATQIPESATRITRTARVRDLAGHERSHLWSVFFDNGTVAHFVYADRRGTERWNSGVMRSDLEFEFGSLDGARGKRVTYTVDRQGILRSFIPSGS